MIALLVLFLASYNVVEGHWPGHRSNDFFYESHAAPLVNSAAPQDFAHAAYKPDGDHHPEAFYYPSKPSSESANLMVDPKPPQPKWSSFAEADKANEIDIDSHHKHGHRHRLRGSKGEINIKWIVQPIPAERYHSSKEVRAFMQRLRSALNSRAIPHPDDHLEGDGDGEEDDDLDDTDPDMQLRRDRRQATANFNMQPFLRRMFTAVGNNGEGLFNAFGRKTTRQAQSASGPANDQMLTSVFQSAQNNFKRFMRLNVAQMLPRRLF